MKLVEKNKFSRNHGVIGNAIALTHSLTHSLTSSGCNFESIIKVNTPSSLDMPTIWLYCQR
ncbi:MAG: hypothetical protein HOP07_18270 [Bacteriovoracaceae bacterium]|nr:hypothetical protein [Bacteriovoracaceae bacterium]